MNKLQAFWEKLKEAVLVDYVSAETLMKQKAAEEREAAIQAQMAAARAQWAKEGDEEDVLRIDFKLMAYESFLRRACSFQHPFVLKGGFSLKQYFDESVDRKSEDIDWVYNQRLKNETEARAIFDDWLEKVFAVKFDNDRVSFKRSTDDKFWEMIDYADADDFPTTGTDLIYYVDNNKKNKDYIRVEVSFNIALTVPTVSFTYTPFIQESFEVPAAVSLPVQIGWKLHQSISSPRFKDVFDLIHLLEHPSFNNEARQQAIQELVNECSISGDDIKRLEWYMTDKASAYARLSESRKDSEEFKQKEAELKQAWGWHHFMFISLYDYNEISSKGENPYKSLEQMLGEFKEILNRAGFTTEIFNSLPAPDRQKVAYTQPNPSK